MTPYAKRAHSLFPSTEGAGARYGIGVNLISKRAVQNLLKKYQAWPSKKLGQNFLIDKKVIKKLTEAANLKPRDIILEIGPGTGNLTQELAKKVKEVIAIEKDEKMVEILKETLKEFKNIKIVKEDVLKISNFQFLISDYSNGVDISIGARYKVVGNLPFYLTAPVIRKFLETEEIKPDQTVLMVQKEIGQRICARPPDMNLLAVSVQFYARPEIISYISKKSFWPQPKVDGAIIRLKVKSEKLKINKDLFFEIVKAGFAHPRKQLINNLSGILNLSREKARDWLFKSNIQPGRRAETLTVEDWITLTKNFQFVVK